MILARARLRPWRARAGAEQGVLDKEDRCEQDPGRGHAGGCSVPTTLKGWRTGWGLSRSRWRRWSA